ncbi:MULTISPECIES: hypothetical protein [unclassified Halomonas]|uniref:hypothetical protein n=1 Tax=unclassified Halomonas TaxID=2609666 RepID=UPI00055888B6|nr:MULTISPECIES: hypothetical protein [unclassified Halomonas]CEP34355.1 Putative uncharacterized protein [Halomonas sp. R57-5]
MDHRHVAVGGDFNRIFDHNDYLAMISIPDEATCILRGHLILEEVLNLWSSKVTNTEDLYAGIFVSFKTKLVVSRNLGISEELFTVLDKVNDIRNKFSHRKGYQLEKSQIESLKNRVDDVVESAKVQKCETFHVFVGGKDENGNPKEITYTWENSDNRVKFALVFVILMLKLTHWIQSEFNSRGITYTIVSTENS